MFVPAPPNPIPDGAPSGMRSQIAVEGRDLHTFDYRRSFAVCTFAAS